MGLKIMPQLNKKKGEVNKINRTNLSRIFCYKTKAGKKDITILSKFLGVTEYDIKKLTSILLL